MRATGPTTGMACAHNLSSRRRSSGGARGMPAPSGGGLTQEAYRGMNTGRNFSVVRCYRRTGPRPRTYVLRPWHQGHST